MDGGDAGSSDAGDASKPENDSSGPGATCTNGSKDGEETDVDCGGPVCPACASSKACKVRGDCASLVCAGTTCDGDIGCSDGTREGFTAVAAFPNIAGCSGAWSVEGVIITTLPACGRLSGNSSINPVGAGCNVTDLCQVGWHLCSTSLEVMAKTGGMGCLGATNVGDFFVTRQSGPGFGMCGAGSNDLFGCGGVGLTTDPSCAPLDRFSGDLCGDLPATWSCGPDAANETNRVKKTASDSGGALCCRD